MGKRELNANTRYKGKNKIKIYKKKMLLLRKKERKRNTNKKKKRQQEEIQNKNWRKIDKEEKKIEKFYHTSNDEEKSIIALQKKEKIDWSGKLTKKNYTIHNKKTEELKRNIETEKWNSKVSTMLEGNFVS